MGFSGASLAVRKDSGVFSKHEVFYMPASDFVEKKLLRDEFSENSIKTVAIFPVVDHRSVVFVVV